MVKRFWIWPISLVVLAAGPYARTLNGEFLRWDDRQNILLNPFIARALWSETWTRPYYNMFIPVTYSVWTVLWHITPEPWIFHALNVTLHALNTLFVYLIARRVFAGKSAPAWWTAALFAVHPLQVETVAWISTGRDLLSAAFGLAAAWLVMTRASWRGWSVATVLFGLGLLSKPTLAVLPAAVAVLCWATGDLTRGRRWTLGLWLIPGMAAVIATKIIQQVDADLRLPVISLLDRVLVTCDTLAFYARRVVVPVSLSSDYGRSPTVVLNGQLWVPGLCATLVLGTLLYIFRRRLSRASWAGAGWTLVCISPVLGLIPFQAQGQSTVADRYAYLPMIGVALWTSGLAARHWRWALVPLLALGALTVSRAEVWLKNSDFFLDMLANNPDSFVAHSSLGVEYILQQRYDLAGEFLNKAIAMKPTDTIPRTNLAQLYLLLNRPDRVTQEVAPLLKDREFLRQNQTETRALASAFRLTARAHWLQGEFVPANELFCRWFGLDWENEEGKAEFIRFLKNAAERKVAVPGCDKVPTYGP